VYSAGCASSSPRSWCGTPRVGHGLGPPGSGVPGSVLAVKTPAWLDEHAEDAPFGHGGETKRDIKVRNARRLIARGGVEIAGFDLALVLGEIEAALSPRSSTRSSWT